MTLPDTAAAVIDSDIEVTVRLKLETLSLDTEDECNAVSHSVEHGEYWHCCHTDDVAVRVVTGVDVLVHTGTDAERRTGDD